MKVSNLTKYSRDVGCECKIPIDFLEELNVFGSDQLIESTYDDASLTKFGEDQYLLNSLDFFTPIVDHPEHFGMIAAANAISDIYAMGGRPISALAILGWPIFELTSDIAAEVIQGAKIKLEEIGLRLTGGHSIINKSPIFGLSVSGIIDKQNLKQKAGAKAGDLIYITKPIGSGTILKKHKQEGIKLESNAELYENLIGLNKIGEALGKYDSISSMTDITGFGLAGHLIEICNASNQNATIYTEHLPVFTGAMSLISDRLLTNGTIRNKDSFSGLINCPDRDFEFLVNEPQTNGGLLFTVDPLRSKEIETMLTDQGEKFYSIGEISENNSREKINFQ